jgi:hypothetical protein
VFSVQKYKSAGLEATTEQFKSQFAIGPTGQQDQVSVLVEQLNPNTVQY